jgi:uncharacterized repeat protein (TIGR03987 family)
MVAALGLYSVGVWTSFLTKRLRPWHLGCFWGGFLADSAGTELMRRMAGGFHWSLHTATGVVALFLMLAHALSASAVMLRGNEHARRTFPRVSVAVWSIWLIPFTTGLLLRHRAGP